MAFPDLDLLQSDRQTDIPAAHQSLITAPTNCLNVCLCASNTFIQRVCIRILALSETVCV